MEMATNKPGFMHMYLYVRS